MLRKRHFWLYNLGVPLLFPFDRDEVVVTALLEQSQRIFDRNLTLAEQK